MKVNTREARVIFALLGMGRVVVETNKKKEERGVVGEVVDLLLVNDLNQKL